MTLRTEIVTDPVRFTAVQPDWQALWARSGGYIFQSHDWIAGWLFGVRDRKEIKLQIAQSGLLIGDPYFSATLSQADGGLAGPSDSVGLSAGQTASIEVTL